MRVIFFLSLMCLSCRPADVVAEVGGRRITVEDVKLQMQRTGASADDSLKALVAEERLAAAAAHEGLDATPEFRAQRARAERSWLTQALLARATGPIDEALLRKRYAEDSSLTVRRVEVAQLFIALPQHPTAEQVRLAQGRATAAWARVRGGEAFEDVVRAVSEDPASREKGGTLGRIREGQTEQALFDAAASLAEGQVSAPVQTSFGVHLLKALAPVSTIKPTFEEARGMLEARERERILESLKERTSREIEVRQFEAAMALVRGEGR